MRFGVKIGGLVGAFALAALVLYALIRTPFLWMAGFGVLFALLVLAAVMLKGAGRSAATLAASLVFSLAVMEVLSYAFLVNTNSHKIRAGSFVTSRGFQPDLGFWVTDPGVYTASAVEPLSGTVNYDVRYTIDSHHLRTTQSAATGAGVAFLGCSVMFGEGVQDTETMPQVFADLTGRQFPVVNLGLVGYGLNQVLRMLETGLFDQVIGNRPRAFVLLTGPWHAARSACRPAWQSRSPRYQLAGQDVVYQGPCFGESAFILRTLLQKSNLWLGLIGPLLETASAEQDLGLYFALLEKIVQVAKERYHAPVIILYESSEPGLEPFDPQTRELRGLAARVKADVLDVSLPTPAVGPDPYRIPGDGHPTPLAHRLRTEWLVRFLTDHRSNLLQPRP